MVFQKRISPEIRAYIHFKKSHNIADLSKEVNVSRSQIYRILKSPMISEETRKKMWTNRGGRPQLLSSRDKSHIIREVKRLRLFEPNWTVRRLQHLTNKYHISLRTLSRFLNNSGYRYLQTRRKGLLSEEDCRKRMRFAKIHSKLNSSNLWTDKIEFYLDGVGFTYKRNPKAQANSPKARIWRRSCEGLEIGCTSRGNKSGTGGKYVKLIVAISHRKGVVCCVPYKKMDGNYFSTFIKAHFNKTFKKSGKVSRIFLQDGDPSQNSAVAKRQMRKSNAVLFPIPPRSPDINPIENFFNNVQKKLDCDAIKYDITVEEKTDFETRVIETMYSMNTAVIDKTIESMGKRMHDIIKRNGRRTKY